MASLPQTPGVYRFRCIPTGMFYVGGTKNLQKRHGNHRYDLRHNRHDNARLQAAWDEYGAEAFVFEVLEPCPADCLIECEQRWIDATQCFDPAIGFNYRLRADSDIGLKRTGKALRNIQEASARRRGAPSRPWSPERLAAHRAAQLTRRGRPFTEEHRQKLREAKLGKKRKAGSGEHLSGVLKQQFAELTSDERALRVASKSRDHIFILTDPCGVEQDVFNLAAFCREHKFDRASFARILQGKKSSYKGWTIRRAAITPDFYVKVCKG